MKHEPVLREEVQEYLQLKSGEKVIDATLGLGGHSRDILQKICKSGRLYVFEQDQRNLRVAQERLESYKDQIRYFHDNFRYLKSRITGGARSAQASLRPRSPLAWASKMSEVLPASGVAKTINAILFDLGLSSPHVDDPERGFSFMQEGPLDMRFDKRSRLTAEEIVNIYPEERLVEIFFKYGEEKFSRKIAREICKSRKEALFKSTVGLANFISDVVPAKFKKKHHHPATQIFQALRIEVNDELNALEEALSGATELLAPGGRIVIISYHSLEDRLVKQFFKDLLNPEPESYEQSLYSLHGEPFFESLAKKPVIPSQEEIERNPRSRSAKLRAYKKIKPLKMA